MKRILLTIAALFSFCGILSAGTYTTNLHMYKPTAGENNWANTVNVNNWDNLDTVISRMSNSITSNTATFDILTTKGDLLTRNSTTFARFAVGTDGYALKSDSTAAAGLAWTNYIASAGTASYVVADGNNRTASATPGANVIPVAGSDGKLASGFFSVTNTPLYNYTVTGSAVTTVTTNGTVTLDANTAGGYDFEFIILNGYAGNTNYRLYYNNDTTNTNYNYDQLGSAVANDAVLGPALGNGYTAYFKGSILIANGYVSTMWSGFHRNDAGSISIAAHWMHTKLATVTNLTRIDIVSDQTGGININSRFRIWKRI